MGVRKGRHFLPPEKFASTNSGKFVIYEYFLEAEKVN